MSDRQDALTQARLQIILCRSEIDAEAFRKAGFKSVRVVEHAEAVCIVEGREAVVDPTFAYFTNVVLAFPNEDAELRDGVAVRIGDVKCRWIDWPGNATPADFLASHGPDALRAIVSQSRPMWTDEVCLMSDVPESGQQRTYLTGFDKLDEAGFRLIRPVFWPVIGPYGSGKSVLVRQLACNLYRLHGWKTLITSFEEKIKPRYQRDLRRHLIGEDFITPDGVVTWRPKFTTAWTAADVERADKLIEDGFRFLRRPRNGTLDVNRLVDRIEYAVRVYGVDVVIIDPVNEIDHQVPKGESKTDYMGRFIMALKQLADDYDLVMIVCAHPPKDGVEKRSNKGRLLTLNDGADTAHYGNKADIGWCVWRPTIAENGPTYLNIDKLKDHEVMGKPTLAKLMLNDLTGGFNIQKIGYEEVAAELLE